MQPAPALDDPRGGPIMAVLGLVPDPEIPAVSVVDLGIVRGLFTGGDGALKVRLTPTYTGCPATQLIERSVREALDAAGFRDVAIETVLAPAWSTDMISEAGREKLRAYGIAPPPRGAPAVR
jgi:ring-1,2-phenylacetyl-CoA epoxidase subunit PaaD